MSPNIRLAAVAGLLVSLTIVAYLLLRDPPHTLRAQFQNAGQLVEGGRVQVAGRKVGTISEIDLTADGLAEVELAITDRDLLPLHEGTRASIRALGQAGVANRRVELSPGPVNAPELADGAVLPPERTTGIVDLDALLSSFGADERAGLRRLIARSAKVYAGSGSRYFNRMLAKLDPALGELSALSGELARDRTSVERLIRTAGTVAEAVASRQGDLRSAVEHSARTMTALADERRALAGLLDNAPGALAQARATLAGADRAVRSLRPTLRELPASGPHLRELLRRIRSMLPASQPVVAELRRQLPELRRSLAGLDRLELPAVAGLRSTAGALEDSRHILEGARFYGMDLYGILNGLIGVGVASYDRAGHYGRVSFTQPAQTLVGGTVGDLLGLDEDPLVPGLFHTRTGLTRRCPGGNAPPAIDGSSPWIPAPSLCDPSQSIPASVNEPGGPLP